MILNGNTRSGAADLSAHLLNAQDNEHVTVHQPRGFACDTLPGALNEAYAMSQATKCKKFLYSLSLNPPMDAEVSTVEFEAAIDRAEEQLGLSGQSRAIVFHEKHGRRHAHVVWSRIDAESMRAVEMVYDRMKLMDLSRSLFREYSWTMPEGMIDRSARNPDNFDMAQWQQAKRIGKDPRALKVSMRETWETSDNAATFQHAMRERGFLIAEGRRGRPVAVDQFGEVYALARWIGVKTHLIRDRLGDMSLLPNVQIAQQKAAENAIKKVDRLEEALKRAKAHREKELGGQKAGMIRRHQGVRRDQAQAIEKRWQIETQARQDRFSKGLSGLWDRVTGTHGRIKRQNEKEALTCLHRDRRERDQLSVRQLAERRRFDQFQKQELEKYDKPAQDLQSDRQAIQAQLVEARARAPDRSGKRQDSAPSDGCPRRDGPEL